MNNSLGRHAVNIAGFRTSARKLQVADVPSALKNVKIETYELSHSPLSTNQSVRARERASVTGFQSRNVIEVTYGSACRGLAFST